MILLYFFLLFYLLFVRGITVAYDRRFLWLLLLFQFSPFRLLTNLNPFIRYYKLKLKMNFNSIQTNKKKILFVCAVAVLSVAIYSTYSIRYDDTLASEQLSPLATRDRKLKLHRGLQSNYYQVLTSTRQQYEDSRMHREMVHEELRGSYEDQTKTSDSISIDN